MAVPAPIQIGATAIMLANPAMIAPVVALYTANAAVRIGFKAAEYKTQKDIAASLGLIAERLITDKTGGNTLAGAAQDINQGIQTMSNRFISANDIEGGLSDVATFLNKIRVEIRDLEAGIDELHIHINNLLDSQDHEQAWSRHTPS